MTTDIARTSTQRDEDGASGLEDAARRSADDAGSSSEVAGKPTIVTSPTHAFDWRRRYANALRITDFVTILVVVFGAQIWWLGLHASIPGQIGILPSSYTLFSVLLTLVWYVSLSFHDTRTDRVIGVGATEYKRVFDASFKLFGAVAIIAFLAQISIARGYLLLAFPIGVLALFAERWVWRRWLGRRRRAGAYSARVVLVGSERSVLHLARELERAPAAGYTVVGACLPTGRVSDTVRGSNVPVLGNVNAIERALAVSGADTVVITSTDEIGADRVKKISWTLEAGRQHLVLAPSITDIAGPRIHMRPASGVPLMHVETPRFSSGQRFVKRTMDLLGATSLVILLSPVMLLLALIVKFTSSGPIIYRQPRVGRHGRTFDMLKFRSMVVDADKQLESLLDLQDMGNTVQFKMRNDPRVTPVGRIMRKYSLDELPQLLNVVGGSMSLVGPRPPIQREVDQYDDHVHRRFLVKPGITGLWQVSGRSSLSWDDSVRLDLSYVENWSVMGDIIILFKTFRAALLPGDTVA
ncbi:sugar transferase [Microbacterium paludicola]|uniref:sugar transferase n=1 Tax=Microbacterium paludicola TaxID=300019 RepID=UPI0031DA1C28